MTAAQRDQGAEILRRAAALMRERAEVASHAPWTAEDRPTFQSPVGASCVWDADGQLVVESVVTHDPDAEHIASWHPAVALAVADWLDREAAWEERGATLAGDRFQALAVARAYLGESA